MSTKRKAIVAAYVLIISLVCITVASYAWMTMSTAPTVSDLALTIVSDNALLIAPDIDGEAGEYSSIIDLSGQSEFSTSIQPCTYVASKDAFYAPNYSMDGRCDFSSPILLTDEKGDIISSGAAEEDNGYLYTMDFWIKTDISSCYVALTSSRDREAGTLGGGTYFVGEPVWNSDTVLHEDEGSGAQNAMRIALRVDDEYDEAGNLLDEGGFYIYEPNADGGSAADTYSIDGTLLQGDNKLIRQQSSTWEETDPVLRDTVLYKTGSFIVPEDETEEEATIMFHMNPYTERHVRLYIWLEGQDADCSNQIEGASLLANIQLAPVSDRSENITSY